jgi:hypothetical protein
LDSDFAADTLAGAGYEGATISKVELVIARGLFHGKNALVGGKASKQ